MADNANATVLCRLGHGLFILPAAASQRQCPHCGAQLIDVDDQTPARSFRFVPLPQRDIWIAANERPAMALHA